MKRILMVLVVGVFGAAASLSLAACGDKKPATDPSAMSAPTTPATGTDTSTMPSTPSTDATGMPSTSATP
ncbi:MAG: hypothetical protein ABI175_24020 [Polyangiales bacterium]